MSEECPVIKRPCCLPWIVAVGFVAIGWVLGFSMGLGWNNVFAPNIYPGDPTRAANAESPIETSTTQPTVLVDSDRDGTVKAVGYGNN